MDEQFAELKQLLIPVVPDLIGETTSGAKIQSGLHSQTTQLSYDTVPYSNRAVVIGEFAELKQLVQDLMDRADSRGVGRHA